MVLPLLLSSCRLDVPAGGEVAGVPGWDTVQATIFQTRCTVCHAGSYAPMGLALTDDQYDTLVAERRPSAERPELHLIEPGDRANSYLYLKITNSPNISGSKMSLNATLDPMEIEFIGAWVDAGAPRNGDGSGLPWAVPDQARADWDWIQANVFQKRCTRCHGGATPTAGLSLEADQYETVVGSRRLTSDGVPLVQPGDSAGSALFHKVTGQTRRGNTMPLGGYRLAPEIAALIETWIDAGAPRSTPFWSSPAASMSDVMVVLPPPRRDGVDWRYVQRHVLGPFCTECHNNAYRLGGVSFQVDQYEALVTAGQLSNLGEPIVLPGRGAESVIVRKLMGDPACGARMPLNGPYLARQMIDLISGWIDAGAPGGAEEPTGPAVDWYTIQSRVFAQHCVQCHNGRAAMGGLSLEASEYDALVSGARPGATGLSLIQPGDAQASYLFAKVIGAPGISGARMPRTGLPLNEGELALLGAWIDAGAPRIADRAVQAETWEVVQRDVFEPFCVRCHGGALPAMGLSLESDAFDMIVSGRRASVQHPALKLVAPGNRAASYLYEKLVAQPAVGERMPYGAPALSTELVELVGAWIDLGAISRAPLREEQRGAGNSGTERNPTWNEIQARVFQPRCVACHGGDHPIARLRLEADQYDALVTAGQRAVTGMPLVTPGDSGRSYLVTKVLGSADMHGSRMPFGGPYLDQATLDMIVEWIDRGAPAAVGPAANDTDATALRFDAASPERDDRDGNENAQDGQTGTRGASGAGSGDDIAGGNVANDNALSVRDDRNTPNDPASSDGANGNALGSHDNGSPDNDHAQSGDNSNTPNDHALDAGGDRNTPIDPAPNDGANGNALGSGNDEATHHEDARIEVDHGSGPTEALGDEPARGNRDGGNLPENRDHDNPDNGGERDGRGDTPVHHEETRGDGDHWSVPVESQGNNSERDGRGDTPVHHEETRGDRDHGSDPVESQGNNNERDGRNGRDAHDNSASDGVSVNMDERPGERDESAADLDDARSARDDGSATSGSERRNSDGSRLEQEPGDGREHGAAGADRDDASDSAEARAPHDDGARASDDRGGTPAPRDDERDERIDRPREGPSDGTPTDRDDRGGERRVSVPAALESAMAGQRISAGHGGELPPR